MFYITDNIYLELQQYAQEYILHLLKFNHKKFCPFYKSEYCA